MRIIAKFPGPKIVKQRSKSDFSLEIFVKPIHFFISIVLYFILVVEIDVRNVVLMVRKLPCL